MNAVFILPKVVVPQIRHYLLFNEKLYIRLRFFRVQKHYKLSASFFSRQTKLFLAYYLNMVLLYY